MGNAMRFVTDLSKGILGEADSPELWAEIIGHIPDAVLLKPNVKILNVSCGHGTEADLLVKRMRALGISAQDVNDSIYLLDKYHVFTNPMKRKGYKNVITSDFLEWETDMKFDVVLGNPPYLKRGWKKFLEKMIDQSNNIVASINPDPTSNNTPFGEEVRSILTSTGVSAIVDCTSHFPSVTSGNISYFICSKSNKVPFSFSKGTLIESITKKICNGINPGFVLRGSQKSLEVVTSDVAKIDKPVPGLFSVTSSGLDIKFIAVEDKTVNRKHASQLRGKFFVVNRFFGKNNPDPIGVIDNIEDYFIGYNVLVIKAAPSETIDNFRSVYCSALYRLVISNIRQGGFDITQSGLSSLERLPLTRTWTDQELYAHFGLTQEEIDYVEANVK